MKRLIKFWGNYSDKCEFSNCSTKYEVLPYLAEDSEGVAELMEIALSNGIKFVGEDTIERKQWERGITLTHALRLVEPVIQDSGVYLRGEDKPRVAWLGFVTLLPGVLEPKASLDNSMSREQAAEIINNQQYGISDVVEIDGTLTLVRENWDSHHALEFSGYSIESFRKHYPFEIATFSDEVTSCHECGEWMYETNGMNYNFVIVECTLYGIECGCWEHFKENGLVVDAKAGDAGKQGIHLLNPTQDEIDDAIERCERDGFSTIYRHTARTWPKGKTELKLAKG